jgi:predicted lipoprotein
MAQWQEAELFSFGPASPVVAAGGKSLRDPIYSWPAVSRCKVDEQLVAETYATPAFATSLVNGRGLAAYEYLAFYGEPVNGCSSFSPINANGTWNALGAEGVALRKRAYAAAVADDVAKNAEALRAAWEPSGGNFSAQLAAAGSGSTTFAAPQDAFNAITESLFYLEKTVKDLKLGRPLGYIECTKATCPEGLESLYARSGTAHLRANLAGFRRLFQGCGEKGAGLGFDDWLIEVGAGDLASRMIAALVATQAAVDALDPPLETAIESGATAPIAALHTTLRALTDPLKTEFITVLNLELPKSAEGDND